jgi:predicted GNAT family acetyltransferase
MSERIYKLERVIPVTGVTGTLREAEERDVPLLAAWVEAFEREALPFEPPVDGEAWARRRLASPVSHTYLWEVDGQPVSMVGCGNPTPHGIRVGPVYTPPGLRGHGYGSACVAAACQRELDAGRRYCFLYADLANPTSNHIYQAVGYEPVSDVAMYTFPVA